ncbi:dihydrofolate reductase family protein [Microbacterium sp. 22242]|uniref:dihydrofolate reductase family protein n=1 Tax=Microbacterium sp. 22242 TaxID=3453896 RepID=UPI003F85C13B
MRRVTYSLALSLDGYAVDPHGSIDWGDPGEETFRVAAGEVDGVGVHLLGRRLYETMRYWEAAEEDPRLSEPQRSFAAAWNALPKVVFSRTLTEVSAGARLATGTLSEEIERLRAQSEAGDIAIGGATLAAQAATADLIDEYRMRICPVLVGGGLPFFPELARRTDLELIENRTLDDRVVYLRYRVLH